MQIMYKGRPFILEDGGDCMRLTSVEKKNGRTIILEFTKDEEESEKAVKAFTEQLRKTIISNHFKGI
ncbi:hypothetical protein [Fictibacillus phosphorivorans]|uniref:hypothetical protein n=1 Tax=Fictibacillus phosphorivorans TaxID=1221500 RepID=UPI0035E77604